MTPAADLELRLRPAGADGAYPVELRLVPPDGAAGAHLARGASVRLDAAARAELLALTADPLAYGARLAELLFADPGLREGVARARALAAGAGAPLRVRLWPDAAAPELHALAWETLRDPDAAAARRGGRFLFADERVLLSRYLDGPDLTPVARRPRPGLRALVAVADPADAAAHGLAPVDAAGEVARARAALGDVPVAVLARAHDGVPVTLANLAAALRGAADEAGGGGPDVLYLVCHGGRERTGDPGAPGGPPFVCLEREDGRRAPVPAAAFVETLAALPRRPVLVVLAACQSAGRTHDAGALAAVGPGLAAAGVGAVVAMQTDVTVATVARLMPVFFRELRRDGAVDRALAAARAAVTGDRPDWWAPVLFLRLRDGRLWAPPAYRDVLKTMASSQNVLLGLTVIAVAALVGYLTIQRLTAVPMSRYFNIAIAPFDQVDERGWVTRWPDERLRTPLGSTLSSEIKAIPDLERDVEVRHVGIPPVTRRKSARSIAEEHNAHIVIYGHIHRKGNNAEFIPEFYISEKTEAEEIIGRQQLGSAVPFSGVLGNRTTGERIRIRTQVLTLFTLGLSYMTSKKYDEAVNYYSRALDDNYWEDKRGKEVIYLFLGISYQLRNKEEDSTNARSAYNNALSVNSEYSRAYIGLGNVCYNEFIKSGNVSKEKVECAKEQYENAKNAKVKPDSAFTDSKVNISLGNIYSIKGQLGEDEFFPLSEKEYRYVTEKFERGESRLRIYAARSYLGLGIVQERYYKDLNKARYYYLECIENVSEDEGLLNIAVARIQEVERQLKEGAG